MHTGLPQAAATPTIAQMIGSFSTSMLKWAASGMKTVTKEQFYRRLATCRSCPMWDEHARMGVGRCKQCGCVGSIKIAILTSRCPLLKWID